MTETSHLIGYGVALSGAVVQSLTFVMVRRVGSSVSFYTNVFYFGWCSALLSGFTMFIFQKPVIPDCGAARWFLVGVGKWLMLSFRILKLFCYQSLFVINVKPRYRFLAAGDWL